MAKNAESTGARPRVVFHVGFPKCASTLLQRRLFLEHPMMHAIGKPMHREDRQIAHLIERLRFTDSISFAFDLEIRQLFKSLLDCERVNVLSCEDFASGPYWATSITKTADRASIARNLHELAPHARILVVLRNPIACLQSTYGQLVTNNRMPRFPRWLDAQFETVGRGSILDMLRFRDFLEAYAGHFGRENILAIDMEDVVAETTSAFTQITDWLNLPPLKDPLVPLLNARRSGVETTMRLIFNRNRFAKPIIARMPRILKHRLAGVIASAGNTVSTDFHPGQRQLLDAFFAPDVAALRRDWDIGHRWVSDGNFPGTATEQRGVRGG